MRIPNIPAIVARRQRRKQREIDIELVWEACKDLADGGDVEHARRAFLAHAMNDPAWTTDLSDAQILEIVNGLT